MKPKFYIIYREGRGAGFFSNLLHVLGHLILSERLGYVPAVDMENYPSLYNEKIPVNGTMNSWEYYFKPVSPYKLPEIYDYYDYQICNGKFPLFIYDRFENNNPNIDWSQIPEHTLLDKYIFINRDILLEVESFWQVNLRKYQGHILGVHFRGWEMGTVKGHPIPPKIGQMFYAIYEFLDKYQIKKIFLSTEQSDYLEIMKKEFGDLIVYTNYFRTPEGINAYKLRPYPRPLHMYNLGKEVLIDCLILSRTDYLIAGGIEHGGNVAGGSNVSFMAQIFKRKNYRDIRLITNGFVK